MQDIIGYSFAAPNDKNDIVKLLKESGLPYEDITEEKLKSFIVAKLDTSIVGCIGIELFNSEGLLRSLVVNKEYRNKKIGSELYNKVISLSVDSTVKTLHLLTTTAEGYFGKKGFIKTDRSNAPQIIKETVEFSSLCPSSSTYMILKLNKS